jgi:hypothetical protein
MKARPRSVQISDWIGAIKPLRMYVVYYNIGCTTWDSGMEMEYRKKLLGAILLE